MNEATFGQNPDIITVGEMSSTTMENCFQYAGADSHELSMVFSFHHLKVDFMGNEKWVLVPTDFQKLKDILFSWQTGMAEHNAWNAVFWCNHDQPRVVSRFGDEGEYWKQSAKMLAGVIHCLRGTPYIYQGEEIGMTNAGFTHLSQYRDVESLNHFQILRDKGMSEESAYNILKVHSRDNSRTPMQWDGMENGGFTSGTPWISVKPNCGQINAAAQVKIRTPSSPTTGPWFSCGRGTMSFPRETLLPWIRKIHQFWLTGAAGKGLSCCASAISTADPVRGSVRWIWRDMRCFWPTIRTPSRRRRCPCGPMSL